MNHESSFIVQSSTHIKRYRCTHADLNRSVCNVSSTKTMVVIVGPDLDLIIDHKQLIKESVLETTHSAVDRESALMVRPKNYGVESIYFY